MTTCRLPHSILYVFYVLDFISEANLACVRDTTCSYHTYIYLALAQNKIKNKIGYTKKSGVSVRSTHTPTPTVCRLCLENIVQHVQKEKVHKFCSNDSAVQCMCMCPCFA